jgi:hypothetical protein
MGRRPKSPRKMSSQGVPDLPVTVVFDLDPTLVQTYRIETFADSGVVTVYVPGLNDRTFASNLLAKGPHDPRTASNAATFGTLLRKFYEGTKSGPSGSGTSKQFQCPRWGRHSNSAALKCRGQSCSGD